MADDEENEDAGNYVDNTYKFLREKEEILDKYGFTLEDFTFLEHFVDRGDSFKLLNVMKMGLEEGNNFGMTTADELKYFVLGSMFGYSIGLKDILD